MILQGYTIVQINEHQILACFCFYHHNVDEIRHQMEVRRRYKPYDAWRRTSVSIREQDKQRIFETKERGKRSQNGWIDVWYQWRNAELRRTCAEGRLWAYACWKKFFLSKMFFAMEMLGLCRRSNYSFLNECEEMWFILRSCAFVLHKVDHGKSAPSRVTNCYLIYLWP